MFLAPPDVLVNASHVLHERLAAVALHRDDATLLALVGPRDNYDGVACTY
jgi:hypothetical protein